MFEKIIRIIKLLCSPLLYKEIFRKQLYYLYEHTVPLMEMKKGENMEIHPTASFRFGKNITIKDGAVIDSNCCIWASENSKIIIGEDTSIGQNTIIISSNHSFHGKESYKKQPMNEKDIYIARNVWIGANSIILSGVTIEEGAIVGAGSIITQDVPEFSIALSRNRDIEFIERV